MLFACQPPRVHHPRPMPHVLCHLQHAAFGHDDPVQRLESPQYELHVRAVQLGREQRRVEMEPQAEHLSRAGSALAHGIRGPCPGSRECVQAAWAAYCANGCHERTDENSVPFGLQALPRTKHPAASRCSPCYNLHHLQATECDSAVPVIEARTPQRMLGHTARGAAQLQSARTRRQTRQRLCRVQTCVLDLVPRRRAGVRWTKDSALDHGRLSDAG